MSEDSPTLTAPHYDSLGGVHGGVVRRFIDRGGVVASLDDGDRVRFERAGITAARPGDEYVFSTA